MSTYCFECKVVHGNNYFPLVVPDEKASIKEFRTFAEKCGCITCVNDLHNLRRCAEVYIRHEKSRDRFWRDWKALMRLNMKGFYITMRRNVLLHVIEGCNGPKKPFNS